jgi:hypothetical protein
VARKKHLLLCPARDTALGEQRPDEGVTALPEATRGAAIDAVTAGAMRGDREVECGWGSIPSFEHCDDGG